VVCPGPEASVTVLQRGVARGDLAHAIPTDRTTGHRQSTLARELALALVCTPPPCSAAPCRTCMQCRLALAGNHPDVNHAGARCRTAGNPAEQIRDLEQRIALLPYQASRSVYIIEECRSAARSRGQRSAQDIGRASCARVC